MFPMGSMFIELKCTLTMLVRKFFKDILPYSGKIGEAKDSRSERCRQGSLKGALQERERKKLHEKVCVIEN